MPSFATLPLENLLEPRVQESLRQPLLDNGDQEDPNPDPEHRSGRPRHLFILPPLCVTPEQAPIPDSSLPDPLFTFPYVLNRKRRCSGNETRRVAGDEALELPSVDEGDGSSLEVAVGENFAYEGFDVNHDVNGNNDNDDDEGFLDPRYESMSVGSEVGENDFLGGRQLSGNSFTSGHGEFFDANDDFSSDGSISYIPSYISRVESELHATKLSILEEIERRKSAEEALILMRSQYERMSNLISQAAGLMFPSLPSTTDIMQLEDNSIDQEVFISRFISEAVGRDLARAEAEEATATIIESKDQEISRLQGRLQYYETVNHELSQRKLVEVARRQQRERKRSQRRWIWNFMGIFLATGVSFVAYSYIPNPSSLESGDLTDTS